MATYPPRRLLGARPLPSDRRRDPRRSGFPPGGGGRWSGDCKAAGMGEACCSSAAVTESGASAAATVSLGPRCFAEGSGPESEGDRRVQGR
ncbi:uncharacterized protein LOC117089753 isoform X2 [Trachypithecus francoisi]|uniref:uncharacterized protein LOC117089753 isoform X2 n=1 Tax=Trachypithecus francoisi TaxID=54180 RepID=UPI00141A86B9|nr:uncharacterized protein LOC117089753 isoform X2 [Trachypithecus francoisi]